MPIFKWKKKEKKPELKKVAPAPQPVKSKKIRKKEKPAPVKKTKVTGDGREADRRKRIDDAKHRQSGGASISQSEKKKSTGSIEFCKKCGSIMLPEKKGILKCRSCGYQIRKSVRDLKIVEEKKKSDAVIVLEKDQTILPMVDKMCPVCENMKAYYWLQQTRSADEPPTQFFRCAKCKHVWREYK